MSGPHWKALLVAVPYEEPEMDLWVNVEDEANDNAAEEAENTRNVRRRPNPNMLIEDSTMTVTGVSQWREALLYNIGAVTLPEGSALNQFDAAWQNAMLLR